MKTLFEVFVYASLGLSLFFIIFNIIKKRDNDPGKSQKVLSGDNIPALNKGTINRKTVIKIFIIVFLSRAALYLLCWGFTHLAGYPKPFCEVWNTWDAPNYLRIAQNGYFFEQDWRLIVFFPLYPSVIWLFSLITGDALVSSLLVSWTCLGVGCVYLYKLVALESDEKTAWRAIKYLLIFPVTVFLGAPYTESMFLMLCFACIYYARVKSFRASCVAGMLAALTRNVGVLLAALVFFEMLAAYEYRIKTKAFCKDALNLLIIPLGTCIYLLMNHLITGNALSFMEFEKTFWFQGFSSYAKTIYDNFENMIGDFFSLRMRLLLCAPQFILMLTAGVCLPFICRKNRTSYSVYSVAYIFVIFSSAFLLSGLRYFMGLAVLYPIMAAAAKRKWLDIILTVFFIILAVTLAGFFSLHNEVM
jgi:Gpi18-like mannosyltransferase